MQIHLLFDDEDPDDLPRKIRELPSAEEVQALFDCIRENVKPDGRIDNVPAAIVNVAKRMIIINLPREAYYDQSQNDEGEVSDA